MNLLILIPILLQDQFFQDVKKYIVLIFLKNYNCRMLDTPDMVIVFLVTYFISKQFIKYGVFSL